MPSISMEKTALPCGIFFWPMPAHWITEYHFDGLRLDATQSIHDNGSHGVHILAEIGNQCASIGHGPQNNRRRGKRTAGFLPGPSASSENGYGLDAVWNDDFHHSAVVALTGRREAYFSDHLGRPQEFISAAKYGYLYQGQYYAWQKQLRGGTSSPTIRGQRLSSLSSRTTTKSQISADLATSCG